MQRYYDFEHAGFLVQGEHSIPEAAVAISEAEFTTLINAGGMGKIIGVGQDGRPALLDPPALTYDQKRKMEMLERWPIEAQLEAYSENAETPSRPEKFNKMQADFAAIRAKYPKPQA